jgi:hypothetical protein
MENRPHVYCHPLTLEEMAKTQGGSGQGAYSQLAPSDKNGKLIDVPTGPFPAQQTQMYIPPMPYADGTYPGGSTVPAMPSADYSVQGLPF